MYFLIFIFKLNLKFVYFFLKWIPIKKNKIVFISRQSNKPSIDFIMLQNKLRESNSNYQIVMLTKKIEHGFLNYLRYYFHLYTQMYHLATSHVCIVDSYCIPVCILKHKKELTVIQIWHAMGAIKKFGYQTLDKIDGRDDKLSKAMCMHCNYDYILSGSKAMIPYFSQAYHVEQSRFIVNGLPRIDYLLQNKKKLATEIKKKYPALKTKKTILYAPTFRNNEELKVDELTNSVNYKKFNLIVKLHPKSKIKLENKQVLKCDKYSALQLLSIADYVITDYSAISIEAASLDIPIFLYLYDYEEYNKNNGLNLDLWKEISPYAFKESKEMIKVLEHDKYDINVVLQYKEKYLDPDLGKYTDKLVAFINQRM